MNETHLQELLRKFREQIEMEMKDHEVSFEFAREAVLEYLADKTQQ